jgi:hypothetical protein
MTVATTLWAFGRKWLPALLLARHRKPPLDEQAEGVTLSSALSPPN